MRGGVISNIQQIKNHKFIKIRYIFGTATPVSRLKFFLEFFCSIENGIKIKIR